MSVIHFNVAFVLALYIFDKTLHKTSNPMRIFCSFLLTLLLFSACQSKYEVVEILDDNGRLSERFEMRRADSVKNGVYERFFSNGTVSERMTYIDGVLQGEHTYFYDNGQVDEIQIHKDGKLNGMYKKYYKNGQLKLELPYVEDVISGEGKGYYENGQVKEVVSFQANQENGAFTEYHENGNLKAIGSYIDGDYEQDTLKLFDTSGALERIMFCNSGRCSTLWKSESIEE